ncbi:MAG: sugar phosphate nucleotidyltransferase [Myxococcota bacterium]
MKVVLFCGGMGLRLRDYSQNTPKPLVPIGYRPVLWHLMNYYAFYGHKDFVLCLGYQADAIKEYFLNYRETVSNDFILSNGGRKIEMLSEDISDWTITFVDTGLHSNIGQRLKAVEPYVKDEEFFLANYSDGLSDLPLDQYVEDFTASGKTACFLSVRPHLVFHMIHNDRDGTVTSLQSCHEADIRINGGFFAFRRDVFDYIRDGEELVEEPFHRMIEARQIMAFEYDGFWQAMDTFKDRQALEEMAARDDAPWQVWKRR